LEEAYSVELYHNFQVGFINSPAVTGNASARKEGRGQECPTNILLAKGNHFQESRSSIRNDFEAPYNF